VQFDSAAATAGDVWQVTAPIDLAGDGLLLLAYAGADPAPQIWRPA
jgi:hypothetical protein